MVKMKNLEIGHEILFVQPLSEIPPNPPLLKGGRGDFWLGRGPRENPGYWLRPCQSTNSFRKVIHRVLFEQSLIL
jgi:hypothetical protein